MERKPCILYTPITKTFWSDDSDSIPFNLMVKTKHIDHPFLKNEECDYVVLRDKNNSFKSSIPLDDFFKHTPSTFDPLGDVCYTVDDVRATFLLFGDQRPITWDPRYNRHTELVCQVVVFILALCLCSWVVFSLV